MVSKHIKTPKINQNVLDSQAEYFLHDLCTCLIIWVEYEYDWIMELIICYVIMSALNYIVAPLNPFPHSSAMLRQMAKPTDELQTKSASMAAQSVFS